jgi:hypothetical protein
MSKNKVDSSDDLASMLKDDPYSCVHLEQGRVWWYFLLSSLLTLLGCLLMVVGWRVLSYLLEVCRCGRRTVPVKALVAPGPTASTAAPVKSPTAGPKDQANHKTSPTGSHKNPPPPPDEIGWTSEAKDWAGQLITGHTSTGRVLVSDTSFCFAN